jgi:hypothetical protein
VSIDEKLMGIGVVLALILVALVVLSVEVWRAVRVIEPLATSDIARLVAAI